MNRMLKRKHKLLSLKSLQEEYIKKYEGLKKSVTESLNEIHSIEKLDKLELEVYKQREELAYLRKEIRNHAHKLGFASASESESKEKEELISNSDSDHNGKMEEPNHTAVTPTKKGGYIQKSLAHLPTGTTLITIIEKKREQLELDCERKLKEISKDLNNKNLRMSDFKKYLLNPKVETKVIYDPFFASKVKKLTAKMIADRARTIAEIDRELFSKLTKDELLSPWEYNKPTNINNKNLVEYRNNFQALSALVKNEILTAKNLKERTLILELWIWTAHYLYHELQDFSGFASIYSAFNSAPISRLKATFEGLSSEAKEILINYEKNMKWDYIEKALDSHQTAIPYVGQLMTDFTTTHESNPNVNNLDDKESKKLELAKRTDAGKKRLLAFEKLQQNAQQFSFTEKKNRFLIKKLENFVSKCATFDTEYDTFEYNQSQKLEPMGSNLTSEKPIKLGTLYKVSTQNQNSIETPRQEIARELILNTAHFLNDVLPHDTYHIGPNFEIDWAKGKKETKDRELEIEAYIAALKEYTKKEDPDSCNAVEAEILIWKLKSFDVKESKRERLEKKIEDWVTQITEEVKNTKKAIHNASKFKFNRNLSTEIVSDFASLLQTTQLRLETLKQSLDTLGTVLTRGNVKLSSLFTDSIYNTQKLTFATLLYAKELKVNFDKELTKCKKQEKVVSAWKKLSESPKLSTSRYCLLSCSEESKMETNHYQPSIVLTVS